MAAPLAPTTPTIGLSQSDFTIGSQASFVVYGSALSGLTNLSISTSVSGIQWSVSSYTGGTNSVQITATPQSNGTESNGGDSSGDMIISVTTGSGSGNATFANILYRQP